MSTVHIYTMAHVFLINTLTTTCGHLKSSFPLPSSWLQICLTIVVNMSWFSRGLNSTTLLPDLFLGSDTEKPDLTFRANYWIPKKKQLLGHHTAGVSRTKSAMETRDTLCLRLNLVLNLSPPHPLPQLLRFKDKRTTIQGTTNKPRKWKDLEESMVHKFISMSFQ